MVAVVTVLDKDGRVVATHIHGADERVVVEFKPIDFQLHVGRPIPIKRIEFEQAEGLTEDCRAHVFTTWAAAEAHVIAAARKAPSDGSYFKCDVGIEWADGTTRGFRFDMNAEHARMATPVSAELRSELLFYSGRWVPARMTAADRDGYLDSLDRMNPGVRERAAKVLDTCDIGVAQLAKGA